MLRPHTALKASMTHVVLITFLHCPWADGAGQTGQDSPGWREQATEKDNSKKLQQLHLRRVSYWHRRQQSEQWGRSPQETTQGLYEGKLPPWQEPAQAHTWADFQWDQQKPFTCPWDLPQILCALTQGAKLFFLVAPCSAAQAVIISAPVRWSCTLFGRIFAKGSNWGLVLFLLTFKSNKPKLKR